MNKYILESWRNVQLDGNPRPGFCYSVLPRVGNSGEAFGEPRYARYAFYFWGKPPSHLLVVSPGRARSSLARQRGWQTTGVFKHHQSPG